ncbi:site-specific integrase [Nocardia vinacea]|uniref:site-specific integrase n=1 Tax=Nocardia vinacea TaxID=96468 RepID=UPI000A0759AA|nr:site-specific integrase [Nocardia vinacea]
MGTTRWVADGGPLVGFAAGFKRELELRGNKPTAIAQHLRLMGQLNRWMASADVAAQDLTPAVVEQFFAAARGQGQRRVPTMATAAVLLSSLADRGVIAAVVPVAVTARDRLLTDYRQHLFEERGLAPTTVLRYERFAKRFLAQRSSQLGCDVGDEDLTGGEVNAYLLATGARLVVESAKREAADLRALLRFLYLRRRLDADLGSAMPPVAAWRGTRLPSGPSADEVDAVLDSCDRSTTSGRRDYAVLTLLARLGLRSGEVAALQLGDIDWRRGEIAVRGKARRLDRLPLPSQVGAAVAEYLRHDRPRCGCPEVILTLYAPPRPIHPSSIPRIVYRACLRAGVSPVGGHRLRHGLATEMLHQGVSLVEIAQVLRHSDLGTTSDYAKIDRIALAAVVQPWPQARS